MSSYETANDGGFVSNISGISDAGALKSKQDGSGFVAAARRQAQRGVFAEKAHTQLMSSAAFLSQTGYALWGEAKNDPIYAQDEVA